MPVFMKKKRLFILIMIIPPAVLTIAAALVMYLHMRYIFAPDTDVSPKAEMVSGDAASLMDIAYESSDDADDTKELSHLQLTVTDSGYDVFAPAHEGSSNYRYGPSIMLHDDGSIDAWFASPAREGNEKDWITYMHSDDGGLTWSDEKVVLSPTPGSKDELSVCDPDVFYYNGYYYMGYTASCDITQSGICNSAFLARSTAPGGPYEKWNGSGWGGEPEPFIYYDGPWNGWGIGEPSFVLNDETLYIYSTRDSYSPAYRRVRSTEVYTADITDDAWPLHLSFAGYAVMRTDTFPDDNDAATVSSVSASEDESAYIYDDCDSWDVAYIEETARFVAVCTNRRFTADSCLLYYESENGVYFERVSELNTNILCGCHNCGIMGDEAAHIKKDDPMLIGYAYSGLNTSDRYNWATRFVPVEASAVSVIDRSEDNAENTKASISYQSNTGRSYPIFITADNTIYEAGVENSAFSIDFCWTDTYRGLHDIAPSELTFSDYDENVVSVKDGHIAPAGEGSTYLTIHYGDLSRVICLRVLPNVNDSEEGSDIRYPAALFSPTDSYTVSISSPYASAVRPFVRYADYSQCELSIKELSMYGISFFSDDTSVCAMLEDGTIIPVSPGDTRITVSSEGGLSYSVPVTVTK